MVVRENGLRFGFDLTRVMFCSGNVTERTRMASPPTEPPHKPRATDTAAAGMAVAGMVAETAAAAETALATPVAAETRAAASALPCAVARQSKGKGQGPCTGAARNEEVVVDLYAGIGYYVLPLLVHHGAAHVHACEWNPVRSRGGKERRIKPSQLFVRKNVFSSHSASSPFFLFFFFFFVSRPSLLHALFLALPPRRVRTCVRACRQDSVAALRHNLAAHGVAHRCTIHAGDNRLTVRTAAAAADTGAAPGSSEGCEPSGPSRGPSGGGGVGSGLRGVADRVNLGLIPSSRQGWPLAVACLKAAGGWLHVHDNVPEAELDAWSAGLAAAVLSLGAVEGGGRERWASCTVVHLERVKSYAPRVHHYVADLFVS